MLCLGANESPCSARVHCIPIVKKVVLHVLVTEVPCSMLTVKDLPLFQDHLSISTGWSLQKGSTIASNMNFSGMKWQGSTYRTIDFYGENHIFSSTGYDNI